MLRKDYIKKKVAPKEGIGMFLAERVLKTWHEDFVDQDTQEIVSIERNEVLYDRDEKVDSKMAKDIEEYGITETFGITGGVLYSMEGCKNKDNSDFKTNLDYINIPILANAYLFKGFAVKVGLQPGFLVRAKEKYSNGGIAVDGDIKDECNKVQLSIPIGLSYEYANFVFDARYNWGLTNTFKQDKRDKKSHNSVFMFTVGYKFAL